MPYVDDTRLPPSQCNSCRISFTGSDTLELGDECPYCGRGEILELGTLGEDMVQRRWDQCTGGYKHTDHIYMTSETCPRCGMSAEDYFIGQMANWNEKEYSPAAMRRFARTLDNEGPHGGGPLVEFGYLQLGLEP